MTEEQRNELAQIIIDLESYIEYCQDKADKIDPQDSECYLWYRGWIGGLDYARRKVDRVLQQDQLILGGDEIDERNGEIYRNGQLS